MLFAEQNLVIKQAKSGVISDWLHPLPLWITLTTLAVIQLHYTVFSCTYIDNKYNDEDDLVVYIVLKKTQMHQSCNIQGM